MTKEQFLIADKLLKEKSSITNEIEIWERELINRHKLGYLQGWNNNHPVKLETSIPVEIFNGFRTASINALKLRLAEIEREFEAI